MSALLLVGTREGLFLIREDGNGWKVDPPLLPGCSINHAVVDARDGVLYACTNNWVT